MTYNMTLHDAVRAHCILCVRHKSRNKLNKAAVGHTDMHYVRVNTILNSTCLQHPSHQIQNAGIHPSCSILPYQTEQSVTVCCKIRSGLSYQQIRARHSPPTLHCIHHLLPKLEHLSGLDILMDYSHYSRQTQSETALKSA